MFRLLLVIVVLVFQLIPAPRHAIAAFDGKAAATCAVLPLGPLPDAWQKHLPAA